MIIRMAKVDIVGPKDDLFPALDLLREHGVFQPDPQLLNMEERVAVTGLTLDPEEIEERAFLNHLHARILRILDYLTQVDHSRDLLSQLPPLELIDELSTNHLKQLEEFHEQLSACRTSTDLLQHDLEFWSALEPLSRGIPLHSRLELFGITVRRPEDLPQLEQELQQRSAGRVHIATTQAQDGSLIGLIATDRESAGPLRALLDQVRVPERKAGEMLAGKSLADRVEYLRDQVAVRLQECAAIEEAIMRLSLQWREMYLRAAAWCAERLALYRSAAIAFATRQCFVIDGWMAAESVAGVSQDLSNQFGGRVVLQQLEILEEDLSRIPVALRNPPLFAPFEIFSRLLPLPKYSSFDPTPFIGIFLPVFFGMILGDIAYGLFTVILAIYLVKGRREAVAVNLGKVLGLAGVHAMFFGLLYGELLGDFGEHWLGLHPLVIDRGKAVVPMAVFVFSVGIAHVLFGMILGAWTSLRQHENREGWVRIISLLVVILIILGGISVAAPQPWLATEPLLILLALLMPLLITLGGLLAPLELLKTLGNMISYIRIMAIGLSSVLLAVVANRLGGLTGDLVTGVLVAGILHGFNLILGIFAPTVHSLRLHYVEFFSKFLDLGGRKFQPWKKSHPGH